MVAFTVLTDFSLGNYTIPKCCWLSEDAMLYWFAVPVILLGKSNKLIGMTYSKF